MYGYITQVDFISFFLETGKLKTCETAMEILIKCEHWILFKQNKYRFWFV